MLWWFSSRRGLGLLMVLRTCYRLLEAQRWLERVLVLCTTHQRVPGGLVPVAFS